MQGIKKVSPIEYRLGITRIWTNAAVHPFYYWKFFRLNFLLYYTIITRFFYFIFKKKKKIIRHKIVRVNRYLTLSWLTFVKLYVVNFKRTNNFNYLFFSISVLRKFNKNIKKKQGLNWFILLARRLKYFFMFKQSSKKLQISQIFSIQRFTRMFTKIIYWVSNKVLFLKMFLWGFSAQNQKLIASTFFFDTHFSPVRKQIFLMRMLSKKTNYFDIFLSSKIEYKILPVKYLLHKNMIFVQWLREGDLYHGFKKFIAHKFYLFIAFTHALILRDFSFFMRLLKILADNQRRPRKWFETFFEMLDIFYETYIFLAGCQLLVKGKFGKKLARTKIQLLNCGYFYISNLSHDLEYASIQIFTKPGCLGVKLWISYLL